MIQLKTVLTLASWLRNYSLFCIDGGAKDGDRYDADFAVYMHDTNEYIKLIESCGEIGYDADYR